MAIEPDDGPSEGAEDDAQGEYEVDSDDRTWAVIAHASAFAGFVVPFGNVLGPLLVWTIKRDESQFVAENSREAVNFQLSWTIWLVAAALSILVLVGLVLLPVLALVWVVLVAVATVRASEDEVYDYPLTLDFVS